MKGSRRTPRSRAGPSIKPTDELVLVTPRDFEPDGLTLSQFRASNLLLREHGSGSRRVVETALGKAGFKLKSFKEVMTLGSTEAIKSAVETGLGVGFVSRWAISKELELGTLKVAQVNGLRVTRHFTLISRTGPDLVGPAGALRTFALGRAHFFRTSHESRSRRPLLKARQIGNGKSA
jgi:DNA-binding transcriptional LysR family regulator